MVTSITCPPPHGRRNKENWRLSDWSTVVHDEREQAALEWIKQRLEEQSSQRSTGVLAHHEAAGESVEVAMENEIAGEDGIVQVGGHTYLVAKDGKLIPADSETRFGFALTAIEGYRLKAYARKHNTTITALIREALGPIIAAKSS